MLRAFGKTKAHPQLNLESGQNCSGSSGHHCSDCLPGGLHHLEEAHRNWVPGMALLAATGQAWC